MVGATTIDAPVAPFDHVTVPAQPVAVKVDFSPAQTVSALTVITGGVGVVTVTVLGVDAKLTQSPTLQVAVYVVVALGDTVIDAPVAPVDQVTVPVQPVAVSVALPPTQMVSDEQVITGGSTLITWIVFVPASLTHLPFLQMAE